MWFICSCKLSYGNMRGAINSAFPNELHKNIFGRFSRVTGKKHERPLDLGTKVQNVVNNDTTATIMITTRTPPLRFFPRPIARVSGTTPGARVVPLNSTQQTVQAIRCEQAICKFNAKNSMLHSGTQPECCMPYVRTYPR